MLGTREIRARHLGTLTTCAAARARPAGTRSARVASTRTRTAGCVSRIAVASIRLGLIARIRATPGIAPAVDNPARAAAISGIGARVGTLLGTGLLPRAATANTQQPGKNHQQPAPPRRKKIAISSRHPRLHRSFAPRTQSTSSETTTPQDDVVVSHTQRSAVGAVSDA
jgi:hypothetical protein